MRYLNYLFSVVFASGTMVFADGISSPATEQVKEEHAYFPIESIFPGQTRFSRLNVERKLLWLEKTNSIRWDAQNKSWTLAFDEGRSPLELKKAVPLVRAPFGYVLIDGHHDTISAIEVGATSIPGKVILDLSNLSEDAFWQEMEERGLAFRFTLSGQKVNPPRSFSALEDDTNRYFAALITRKYSETRNPKDSFGSEYPVWLKVGRSIPFIEFIISDELRKAGIEYTYDMGDNPPEEIVEKARKAISQAGIPNLPVIPVKVHYTEL